MSDPVFMRTRESPNQCLVVTCCNHPTSSGQLHRALLHFGYCILSHITTPLVSRNVIHSGHSHMSVA